MKKLFLSLILSMSPLVALAAGAAVELDHIETDITDKASLQRGVQTYMNYCMACHSLEYARYNRVEGSQTKAEYDETIYDLANFLDYMGEPYAKDRERIGWMVFAFLAVFLVIGQLLYRELWKDIH